MKFTLQRIHLNNGGYDSSGAYWGTGQPLYWACHDGIPIIEYTFRAYDRAHAKSYVRARHPAAKFYS